MRSHWIYWVILISFFTGSSVGAQSNPTLQSLPDGDYYYEEQAEVAPEARRAVIDVILRKTGNITIGTFLVDVQENPCFRGTISGNQIINVTWADPATEGGRWNFSQTMTPIEFQDYRRGNLAQANAQAKMNLQTCIQVFNSQ